MNFGIIEKVKMSQIHMILQGKGGVGKSLIASFITQKLIDNARGNAEGSVMCIDTDPNNATYAGYQAFDAKLADIVDEYGDINKRKFDELMEAVANTDGLSVMDNGSSTFLPLTSYMKENDVISMFRDMGKEVIIHSVLTGGEAMDHTISGLNTVFNMNPTHVVVWENEFFGAVVRDGKSFRDTKLYQTNLEKILGTVTLKKLNQDTSGRDLQIMITNHLTFSEAMLSPLFTMMPRHRLSAIRKAIFTQLDALGI